MIAACDASDQHQSIRRALSGGAPGPHPDRAKQTNATMTKNVEMVAGNPGLQSGRAGLPTRPAMGALYDLLKAVNHLRRQGVPHEQVAVIFKVLELFGVAAGSRMGSLMLYCQTIKFNNTESILNS